MDALCGPEFHIVRVPGIDRRFVYPEIERRVHGDSDTYRVYPGHAGERPVQLDHEPHDLFVLDTLERAYRTGRVAVRAGLHGNAVLIAPINGVTDQDLDGAVLFADPADDLRDIGCLPSGIFPQAVCAQEDTDKSRVHIRRPFVMLVIAPAELSGAAVVEG